MDPHSGVRRQVGLCHGRRLLTLLTAARLFVGCRSQYVAQLPHDRLTGHSTAPTSAPLGALSTDGRGLVSWGTSACCLQPRRCRSGVLNAGARWATSVHTPAPRHARAPGLVGPELAHRAWTSRADYRGKWRARAYCRMLRAACRHKRTCAEAVLSGRDRPAPGRLNALPAFLCPLFICTGGHRLRAHERLVHPRRRAAAAGGPHSTCAIELSPSRGGGYLPSTRWSGSLRATLARARWPCRSCAPFGLGAPGPS